jgi:hypothetical protein
VITHDEIRQVLRRLNEAENARAHSTVEETMARIDEIMDPAVEGWRNGVHYPDREAEREIERKSFGALADYNRTFQHMLIEPPKACIAWTIRGTAKGEPVEARGCSIFEFNDAGRAIRYWMFFNPADFAYRA